MQRLLKVVVVPVKKNDVTTTTFDLPVPDDLSSIELQLRVLAGVIKFSFYYSDQLMISRIYSTPKQVA